MGSLAAANVQFVVVYNGGMSCSASRWRAIDLRLDPVRRLEVENNDVGEVGTVFVLPAKHEEFIALPEVCRVSFT